MDDKKLIKDCMDLYKDGCSRMEVARHIMSETGLKETASKVRAKNIWDENFDLDYAPQLIPKKLLSMKRKTLLPLSPNHLTLELSKI